MPFTVFNCGTGANRESRGELVADLAKIVTGTEYVDWIINAGPGSARSAAGERDATPGIRDGITNERRFVAKLPLGGTLIRIAGAVSGHGWEDNVAKSLYYLRRYVRENSEDNVVNMIGWSRGAVTCIMLAHAIADDADFAHLRCHLFLADPVPGPGNFDPNKITLSQNVDDFIAVYQQQEARTIMRPALLNGVRGRDIIYMPGKHATGVKFEKSAVGVVVYSLAQEFLSEHGTGFTDRSGILDDWTLIEAYTEIAKAFPHVQSKPKTGIRKLLSFPDMTGRGSTKGNNTGAFRNGPWTDRVNFQSHRFFVNGHHFGLFRQHYPAHARVFLNESITSSDLVYELSLMRLRTPLTYRFVETIARGGRYQG